MKKIIFFDADGTLWYPKKTKKERHPVWLYRDKRYKKHEQHIELIEGTISTLEKLKSLGVVTILLSTSPYPTKKLSILMKKVNHFNLNRLFDEIHATENIPSSKGEYIEKILKERGLSKESALMVGDSYKWDYNSALSKNIEAVLIKSNYETQVVGEENTIKKLSDLLKII